ncbi:MAG: hypothetical protein LAP85_23720 [Acidobacteriia bacterium]|nr:hypothetical protein [Terriglobia bacterium]
MNFRTAKVRPGRLRKLHRSALVPGCVLLLMPGLGAGLFQAPVRSQTAAKSAPLSVSLKYAEKSSLATRIELSKQEVKFRREPNFGGNDKVIRRALKIGPGQNDFIGFAVNFTSRTLYLDLNQNLDLTDDPQGVYKSVMVRGPSGYFAYFRGVRLDLGNNGINRRYLLEPFYFLGENSTSIGIRSLYEGEIELQGRKWLFQVQDNLDGQFDAQDKFLITPVARSGDPKALTYRPMALPRILFIGGNQYQLAFAFGAASGVALVTATLTEHRSPMAEVTLDGKFVRRLILQGDARLAILESPGRTVTLPADNYRIQTVYLVPAADKPVLTGVSTSETSRITVAAGAPNRLQIGAPFVSSVRAERKGSSLLLSYVLKGAAGEEYTVMTPDRRNPPKFVIYRGDRQVASGNFQFG